MRFSVSSSSIPSDRWMRISPASIFSVNRCTVIPVLVSLLIDPLKAIIIGVFLLITQQIIFNVIGPKLLGKAFSLHPAIILISFLVGLKFAGGVGAIFAIPVLGISAVMIRTFGHYILKVKDGATKTITSL